MELDAVSSKRKSSAIFQVWSHDSYRAIVTARRRLWYE